jgi:propionyl-CoA carboxylase beta chain
MMNPRRTKLRYCWPSGDWGSLPLEAALKPRSRPNSKLIPIPTRLAEIRAWAEALRPPFRTAESFYAEEIIDPRDTRKLLCDWANLAQRVGRLGRQALACGLARLHAQHVT